ncbi:Calcium-binding EF-hand [Cynara cardunculus var. scolymus]|uniref:non-specific serine/threonine protein kinase n=1 Tax=Cynara cardunculus var. scolymus TaxID=59895 RepID=A0A103XXP4_CYNCS|nr:Calcium-binding EF-hand [Cynara cardunculus var. scolymus]
MKKKLFNSVLPYETPRLRDHYTVGKKLGQGQFGITYRCTEKSTGTDYACKSIAKRKLLCRDDYDDVWREIQIMHHLSENPSVVRIKGTYEDNVFVHLVMELCTGGELFDRIVEKRQHSEQQAAELMRTIVGVVEACHSLGVMHRDLKPENFLFDSNGQLKAIDFGLSVFYKPGFFLFLVRKSVESSIHAIFDMVFCVAGEYFCDVVGSPYYVAPEVLNKHYGPEKTDSGIFRQILNGTVDFESMPWPNITESAKDLIKTMLDRNPEQRITAYQILCESRIHVLDLSVLLIGGHPWIKEDGVATDKPLDPAILSRLKQFAAMNKIKKMAMRVIAGRLSEEEIGGLKQLFKTIDTDNSGTITFQELKQGLKRVGSNVMESEIMELMNAVQPSSFSKCEMQTIADTDNNGTIDYGEFLAATLHLNKTQREENMLAAFSFFDKDNSGYITYDELQQACKDFGIHDVQLEEMIKEIDQDDDGRIDYGEFAAMMRKADGEHESRTMRRGLKFDVASAFGVDNSSNETQN